MNEILKNKLIKAYKKMADLTLPECRNNCRCPLSCCSQEYCEISKQFTKEKYNIELNPINKHPTLMFMSKIGCIVPPYLRPHCTLHTCAINSLGFKPNDSKWTNKYFELRNQIDKLEYKSS